MEYIIVFCLLFLPMVVGEIQLLYYMEKNKIKLNFSEGYLRKFKEYVNSGGHNIEHYTYLVKNSNKMQNLLGSQGLMIIKPPFANYRIENYAIILNGLSEIHQYLTGEFLGDQAYQMARIVTDSMLRKIGDLEDYLRSAKKKLLNPIIAIKTGYSIIILIPIYLLVWVGIVSSKAITKILSNIFFRFIIGAITIIGLVSSIITIVSGFETLISIIESINLIEYF